MQDETEQSLEELQRDQHALQELIEGRGWEVLMNIAEGQKRNRTNRVMLTTVNADYTVEAEQFEKGEVSGITLFQTMPDVALEGLEEDIKVAQAKIVMDEEEFENESGNERGAP